MLNGTKFLLGLFIFLTAFFSGAYLDSIYQRKTFPQTINNNTIQGNKIKRSNGSFEPIQSIEKTLNSDTLKIDSVPVKKRFRLFRRK